MSELRQSPVERQALRAAWNAHPKVAALHAAVLAHAVEHGYKFDAAGMTAVSAFAGQWVQENGPLPDSGILIG